MKLYLPAGGSAEFLSLADETGLRDWLRHNSSVPARLLADLYERDWQRLGRNDIACLPPLDPVTLDARILQYPDGFCMKPQWQGRCHESTALNRQLQHPLIADLQHRHGNGLLTRNVARLREIARLPGRMRQLAEHLNDTAPAAPDTGLSDGVGLAQVQAARGLLIHRLELKQGRVYDYRIIAPTEWNFHPEGVAATGLKQLRGDPAELKRQAELWITAIDPCVRYQLRLAEFESTA